MRINKLNSAQSFKGTIIVEDGFCKCNTSLSEQNEINSDKINAIVEDVHHTRISYKDGTKFYIDAHIPIEKILAAYNAVKDNPNLNVYIDYSPIHNKAYWKFFNWI